MAKPTHGIRVTRNTDTMQAVFELINKTTEKVEDTLTLNWADVHEDCRDFTSLYGLTKLVQDRESGTDMLDKLQAYSDCFNETLFIGVTTRERKSGGPTVRIEVEALAQLKDLTVKQTQALLAKYDKDKREQILSNEAVLAKAKEMAQEILDQEDSLDGNEFDNFLA